MTTTFADDPLAMFAPPTDAPPAAQPTQPQAPPPTQPVTQPTQPAAPPPVGQPFTSLDQVAQSAPVARQMASPGGAMVVGLDDDSIATPDFEFYKGKTQWKERIGVLLPNRIWGGRTHFVEQPADKKGQYFCASTFERKGDIEICTQVAPCCERLDAAKFRFSAMIIHYHTQPDGQLSRPFGFKLKVWRFSDKTFNQLRTTHKEWNLQEHDLIVTTEDEKYQRMQFALCKEAITRRPEFLKEYGEALRAWLQTVMPKMEKSVARKLTPAEWAALLQGGTIPMVANDQVDNIADVLGKGL